MAKRDGMRILHSSKTIEVTYYPDTGEVCITDLTAPALSDCCAFFKASAFLKMARDVAKRLPGGMGEETP